MSKENGIRFSDIGERCPDFVNKMKNCEKLFICRVGTENSIFFDYDEMSRWGINPNGVIRVDDFLNLYERSRAMYRRFKYGDSCHDYGLPSYYAEDILKKTGVQSKNSIDVIIDFDIVLYGHAYKSLLNCDVINKVYILKGVTYFWTFNCCFEYNDKVDIIDDYYKAVLSRGLSHDYYCENESLFKQTLEWMSDDISKKTMIDYLRGHIEMAPFSLTKEWVGKQSIYDQYFPRDLIELSNTEVFVDCGAYTGDTLSSFLDRVSDFSKYFAFEPDYRRKEKLLRMENDGKGKIVFVPYGAWSCKTELYFSTNHGECGEITPDNSEEMGKIETDCIDNIIPKDENVTFIKMDIEGAELEALKGATKTIKRCKPRLAICVYHKKEDLITIPQMIKEINPDYNLYLRAHYPWVSETVLYAI